MVKDSDERMVKTENKSKQDKQGFEHIPCLLDQAPLIKFLDLESGLFFEAGRLLNSFFFCLTVPSRISVV